MGQQNPEKIHLKARVAPEQAGQRLDQVAAELFDGYSRSRLQTWIKAGKLRVDGAAARPKAKLLGNEELELDAELEAVLEDRPQQDVELPVIYEDEHIIVLNKPAGLVVHPAAGHADGTLLNGLLAHDEGLSAMPRAGIVHRLDRQTSGLMVVARSLTAHQGLVAQLQDKSLYREYEAICVGVMTGGGTVNQPIGRHPVDRKRQAVIEGGKEALTHYRVEERFRAHTRVRVQLETGRTHQIRVHMAWLHYPLVGDPVYGGRLKQPAGASEALREALRGFRRQALHARRLGLIHPVTGEAMQWHAEPPEDMRELAAVLRADARGEA